ncbi:hypothetical protein M2254_001965 [Chryseobacterium sp. BIGb0186]|nr:hypothetical protein [Chryseobacterium sp. JUb44]MDH6210381.1 hypothetical protein [Chryseobacterium sp. BIGb0186]
MTRQLTITISIQNGKEIELTTLQLSKIVFVMNWILVIDSLKTSSRNEEFMRKAILVYQY